MQISSTSITLALVHTGSYVSALDPSPPMNLTPPSDSLPITFPLNVPTFPLHFTSFPWIWLPSLSLSPLLKPQWPLPSHWLSMYTTSLPSIWLPSLSNLTPQPSYIYTCMYYHIAHDYQYDQWSSMVNDSMLNDHPWSMTPSITDQSPINNESWDQWLTISDDSWLLHVRSHMINARLQTF